MLIRSISGIRGLVEEDFDKDTILRYSNALHQVLNPGVIYAGRDSRESGEHIIEIMIEELIKLGRTIIYCGIVPTPTIQYMVHSTEAVGGFIVTASHNPIEWNGIKFVKENSTFFNSQDCKKLFDKVDNYNPNKIYADEKGIIWEDKNSLYKHSLNCTELKCIDIRQIRNKKYKVVIDSVNGAGSDALPLMLESLGCEVIKLNCDKNGIFSRGTEPLPENLSELSAVVVKNNADVGFAVDPDADRLAVVDENGSPLGEEYTLVLSVDGYIKSISSEEEKFVVNLSSSIALEKLVKPNGFVVERSAVGEINVVDKMNEIGSNLGGEGNGGVILRESHLGRDSLVAVTMVLNRMSQSESSLSSIYNTLPQYKIVKDKINTEDVDKGVLISKATNLFHDAKQNKTDGIKFIWDNKWVHLRSSNTEPIIRIYAEAATEKESKDLIVKVKSLL